MIVAVNNKTPVVFRVFAALFFRKVKITAKTS
jgi:hypothetical protein